MDTQEPTNSFNSEGLLARPEIGGSPGLSIIGDHLNRLRALFALGLPEYADMLVVAEPGDAARIKGVSLSSPIAYDLWYIYQTESVLPMDREEAQAVLDGPLKEMLENLNGVKPLRVLRHPSDLASQTGWDYFIMYHYFENTAPWYIHEIRFEVIPEGGSFWYGGNGSQYAGYLGVPVGQLGVMEVVSLARETEDYDFDLATSPVEGKDMFPPIFTERNACVGEHLVESGFLVQEGTDYYAEATGAPLNSAHMWMRKWLKKEDPWPVPGEFVSILCRPFPLHVWWFQDSCPFIYAGNWVETEYLTSGVIEEIEQPEGEEVGNRYKVRVKDETFWIKATDFYGYEEGDRVAIVKLWGEPTQAFDWRDLVRKGDDSEVTDWFIVPISFYEE